MAIRSLRKLDHDTLAMMKRELKCYDMKRKAWREPTTIEVHEAAAVRFTMNPPLLSQVSDDFRSRLDAQNTSDRVTAIEVDGDALLRCNGCGGVFTTGHVHVCEPQA
jgi:hypothetical protein